jgi:methyltransferase-like protein/SAM-dependent methyltransferase
MTAPSVNAYDEVLYAGHAFPQTHPDRLATMARLFAMNPAPVEACRVLELGCGDGGNLIPMAYGLPTSEFVGLDTGARGIANGRALAQELALRNITLRHFDIMDVSHELGMFDYIIAHGVYSWVPRAVQDKMLSICGAQLKPQGVAYISYSAYPGGHLRAIVCDMLSYHARRFPQPEQQIDQARALLAFLASAQADEDRYGAFLRQELESVLRRHPQSIYHDELAETNAPVYFYQFVKEAAAHCLQYLGEADFFEMQDLTQSPPVREVLRLVGGDLIDKEQYMDFVKCRRFRQTLLCHTEVALDRRLGSHRMSEFYAAAAVRPVPMPEDAEPEPAENGARSVLAAFHDYPPAQEAFSVIAGSWPRRLAFGELVSMVQARIGAFSGEDAAIMGDALLAGFACGKVQLHVHLPRFVLQVSERPVASALARLHARNGPLVTNLRHDSVRMDDELGRELLAALDGTRDRAALLDHLVAKVSQGAVPLIDSGVAVSDPEKVRHILNRDLEANLQNLAKCAVLEG